MCWNISRVLDALSLGPTLGPPSRRFETSPGTQGEVAARAVLTARWPSCAPIHGVAFKSNTSIQPLSSAKKTFDLANIFARRFQKKGERERARETLCTTQENTFLGVRVSNSFHVRSTSFSVSNQWNELYFHIVLQFRGEATLLRVNCRIFMHNSWIIHIAEVHCQWEVILNIPKSTALWIFYISRIFCNFFFYLKFAAQLYVNK